nr:uncharacterized protein LOC120968926 [Aegilops tauschii subsp. strangulata]
MEVDATIEETAKDVAAEAAKVAADEATKDAHEEATKGSAGEAGKETGDRTDGILAAGAPGATSVPESLASGETVVKHQPSTSEAPTSGKYLKIGDDLFVSILGIASTKAPAEGEVFDEGVIAAAGLTVVDEPGTSSSSSKEDQLLQAMSGNCQKFQALHRARKEKLNSRMAELKTSQEELSECWNKLLLKQSDIENAQEEAAAQAAKDDAQLREGCVLLETQEEDLATREELKEAVDTAEAAEAAKNELAGKVEKLEVELEKHSKEVSTLKSDRDKTTYTVAELQVTISEKTKQISTANDSVADLKLKLTTPEETLEE